uniref:PH domain-containing protein n=1 Tax=Macrostomum lignano TaxID=282301 RepID=A0A1I8H5Q8_9PLAT
ILVSGRAPVNFGARVLLEWSAAGRARGGGPSAPHPDRVAATPRLMERWAKGAVAARLGQGRYEVNPACVGDLVIWGDPAGGHWPELDRANLGGEETGAVTGPDWYKRPLSEPLWDQEWVQTDLPRLLAKRQAESWYGIPEGVVFSFPVRFQPKGTWSVVEDFDLSEEALQRLVELAEAREHLIPIAAGVAAHVVPGDGIHQVRVRALHALAVGASHLHGGSRLVEHIATLGLVPHLAAIEAAHPLGLVAAPAAKDAKPHLHRSLPTVFSAPYVSHGSPQLATANRLRVCGVGCIVNVPESIKISRSCCPLRQTLLCNETSKAFYREIFCRNSTAIDMIAKTFGAAAVLVTCLFAVASCGEPCDTYGAEKTVGNDLCRCGFAYILGRRRSDQTEWVCRLNGCEVWNEAEGRNVFYEPGATMKVRGADCQCVKGTDPNLMDAITWYHVVIKAGYLKKQTLASGPISLLRRPTRRWFVFLLFGGLPSLEYYEDAAAARTDPPINSFDLRGCSRVAALVDDPCSFLMALSDRMLTLTADSQQEAADWVACLSRNLAQLADRSKPENIYGTLGDNDEDDEGEVYDNGDISPNNEKLAAVQRQGAQAAAAEENIASDSFDFDSDDIEGLKRMEAEAEAEAQEEEAESGAEDEDTADRSRLLSQSKKQRRQRGGEVLRELHRLEDRMRRERGEAGVKDLRQQLQTVYSIYEGGEDSEEVDKDKGDEFAELDAMEPEAYAVLESKYRELEDWDALTRLRTRRFRSAVGVFRPNPDPPPYQHLTKPVLVSGFFDRKADISVEETQGGQFVVNTLGPGGPRLSPLCASVERLKRQILHPGGVQVYCNAADLLDNVAIVHCAGRLWIAGWNRRATRLHGCLRVGDQVMSVDGFRLESLEQCRRILQGSVGRVALRLRRLPHGKAFCVSRPDGRSLGLVTTGQSAEVAHVQQDGLAAAHGLAYRTAGVLDDANFTTWTLTEVNGRPLRLWPEPKEVAHRLSAHGPEISLVMQPTDLVRAVKAQLKKLSNYKQYIVG